jgi:retinol dehydrogenase 14
MTTKQTILITGATGNIGGGAAVALAKRGARVVLLGRSLERLDARADMIRSVLHKERIECRDTDIAKLVIDFYDWESVKLAAAEALRRFPEINGLIYSFGQIVQNGPNILPSGHEMMFSANVMAPFLFTHLLLERMKLSNALVLEVVNATSHTKIDWNDIESIKNHKTGPAFERTKVCNRVIAAELARRYAGKISSIAFNPSFIIDKSDPELKKRWPKGFLGFFWNVLTALIAKPPAVAGEPIANLMLSYRDRNEINGAMFKLDKRIEKRDKEMNDKALGKRLWDELVRLTGLKIE